MAFASPRFNQSMPLQREFQSSPSPTSQVSTSSVSLYSPDDDLDLFEQSFSPSQLEQYRVATNYGGVQIGRLQQGTQFSSSFGWISESRNIEMQYPEEPMFDQSGWGSLRESSSATTSPVSVESFYTPLQTPLASPTGIISAGEYNHASDTAKMRTSTRRRGTSIAQPPRSSERKIPSPMLRTAQSSRSSTSPNISHPKANLKRTHNMVEKQYRNRLNGGFASLLAKIPLELAASSGLETGGKNVSKAETLALAERYIKMLQEDGKELVRKNRRLEEDYDRLRKAWIASGGVLMP